MRSVWELLEFDYDYYISTYDDLSGLSKEAAFNHFKEFGYFEGRKASELSDRKGIVDLCRTEKTILEIGPFCNPLLRGSNVRYFDVLDKAQLVARATAIGLDPKNAVEIDYISEKGDLGIISDRFAAAFSSHCIEHQPDLIKHLQNVSSILNESGSYYLVIPDKRFCFDFGIGTSNIAEIIEANLKKDRIHSARSVIEHRSRLTAHNDERLHWQGNHGEVGFHELAQSIQLAIDEYCRSDGKYIDVHAWQFTPHSFLLNMHLMHALGMHDFSRIRVFSTPERTVEFTAILSKDPSRPQVDFRIPYEFFGSDYRLPSRQRRIEEIDKIKLDYFCLEAQIAAIRNSWSWKLSKPLRSIEKRIKTIAKYFGKN